jgi:hypothetical protein
MASSTCRPRIARAIVVLIAPVTVQLVNETTELCWEASYPASQLLKNETDQLKARSP